MIPNSTNTHHISTLLPLVRLRQIIAERQFKPETTRVPNMDQIYADPKGNQLLDSMMGSRNFDRLKASENRIHDSVLEKSSFRSNANSSNPKVGPSVMSLSSLNQNMSQRPFSDLELLQLSKATLHRKCILNAMVSAFKQTHNYSKTNNDLVNKSIINVWLICFRYKYFFRQNKCMHF